MNGQTILNNNNNNASDKNLDNNLDNHDPHNHQLQHEDDDHQDVNKDQWIESRSANNSDQLFSESLKVNSFQQVHDQKNEDKITSLNEPESNQTMDQPHSSKSLLSSSLSSSSSSSFSSQPIEQQSSSNQNNNTNAPRTKLFVGRLPESCTSKHLEDLFGKYGTVTECDVVGRYGFVHLSKPEEAEECVKKLNRYAFMGSLLTVEFSTSKIHLEPGTLGRAKGIARMNKGIRPRIHNHTPYHRELYLTHRSTLGSLPTHSLPLPHPPPPHPHPPTLVPSASVPPPPRIYGGYAYFPENYRPFERDIYYDSECYARDRERHYLPSHEHRSAGGGCTGGISLSYDFDSRSYSPPPPSSLGVPPPPPAPNRSTYSIYPSHREIPIRAYERPITIDEPMPVYSSRGSSMTPHKCHYHKCHYDMHVEPYLN